MTRSDVQYAVRNGALHNWKTLVVRMGCGRHGCRVLPVLQLTPAQAPFFTPALPPWCALQANTPRTLQEILPALMAEIIDALADDCEGRGGRTLL